MQSFSKIPIELTEKSCQAIMTSVSCMPAAEVRLSNASTMPDWLTETFFNPELQRQRLNVLWYQCTPVLG